MVTGTHEMMKRKEYIALESWANQGDAHSQYEMGLELFHQIF